MPQDKLVRAAAAAGLLVLSVWVLRTGEALLLPFVCAFILFYLLVNMAHWLERLWPLKTAKLPYPVALGASILVVGGLLGWAGGLLTTSLIGVVQDAPVYQDKAEALLATLQVKYGLVDFNPRPYLADVNFTGIVQKVAKTVSTMASSASLIVIYTLFLLLERGSFSGKLHSLCGTEASTRKAQKVLTAITADINTYLKIKTLLSLLTGTATWAVLTIFGVKYAAFWGIATFALNFIPTIGSIIAVLMVLPAAAVQGIDSVQIGLIATLLVAVQFAVGNVLEPKMMGKSLGLSPLAILVSLAFWGSLWGIMGMLLCVPIMVMLKITLANFTSTRWMAILLSQDGTLKEHS